MLFIDGPLVGAEVAVGANLILDVMVEVISASILLLRQSDLVYWQVILIGVA